MFKVTHGLNDRLSPFIQIMESRRKGKLMAVPRKKLDLDVFGLEVPLFGTTSGIRLTRECNKIDNCKRQLKKNSSNKSALYYGKSLLVKELAKIIICAQECSCGNLKANHCSRNVHGDQMGMKKIC